MTDNKAVAKQEKLTPADAKMLEVFNIMSRRQGKFEDLLPPWMPAERFVAGAKMAIGLNPALANCTPESVLMSLFKAARAGIDVSGGFLGHGALVPYKNECTFQPMYKGLIALAIATGVVQEMTPVLVHERDHFIPHEGNEARIEHIPYVPRKAGDKRGDIIAAYTRVRLPSGVVTIKGLLYLDDIAKVESGVKSTNGPWSTHRPAMIKKTTVKNAANTIGIMSSEQAQYLNAALEADAEHDASYVDGEVVGQSAPPASKGTARLKELAAASKGETLDYALQEPPEGVTLPTMEPGSNG